ncbi:CpsB/CapC family capsule biosynthesis tyrosine phosphatase [Rhodoferax sp.]|uniref:tyrosine-protein phosphatase n=1 Tax=Rhodoferax sp. TaxID=50421 RepID=UPI00262DB344|nr:CpsB/CapC family capsule biosynthesis tyrosine phosphatase [Rhodoferax sp.]MDD3935983.1 hypothetical protein [Rhodoferax sp.]
MHCHVLPGVDDGPRDELQAMALLRAYVEDGVGHVVLTPHLWVGQFVNTRSMNQAALQQLQRSVTQLGLPLTLSVAGEVRLDEHIPALLAQGELPLLGEFEGYRHLLLEMPDSHVPVGADKLVKWLLAQGIRPVLAHPERNRAIRDDPRKAQPLLALGCKMQLTAGSVLGYFGALVMRAAHQLLAHHCIDAIASDAHNVSTRRPCMQAARQWLVQHHGEDMAQRLTHTGPANLCGISL